MPGDRAAGYAIDDRPGPCADVIAPIIQPAIYEKHLSGDYGQGVEITQADGVVIAAVDDRIYIQPSTPSSKFQSQDLTRPI